MFKVHPVDVVEMCEPHGGGTSPFSVSLATRRPRTSSSFRPQLRPVCGYCRDNGTSKVSVEREVSVGVNEVWAWW